MKELRAEDRLIDQAARIHMIGIGGSGMCPLAEILHAKGKTVTGSDNNESANLSRVRDLGISVRLGHSAENVHGADLVVYSAAISEDNPEITEAKKLSIPLMERSHLLGALTRRFDRVIGVCGTHGKTTVSSIITQILYLNKLDPSAVIGGRLPLIGGNGRCGESEYLVCESCEFVDTFLQLSPDISVLLNIDDDHLDYFKTMENLENSFTKFISLSKKAYINGDDERVLRAAGKAGCEKVTFGLSKSCDFYAENISEGERGYSFDIIKSGEKIGRIEMSIPGRHNIYNGLAAFCVCYELGVSVSGIAEAIKSFTGAGRRFEYLYEGKITLVDDYAHHPTEIAATLRAARKLCRGKIIAVFQPFTFSRTALLLDEFVSALENADEVLLTPIMGSREVNSFGVTSEDIAKKLRSAAVADGFENIARLAVSRARDGDMIITMGGGDIYKAAHIIRDILSKGKQ